MTNRKRPKKRKREPSQQKLMELWGAKRVRNIYRMMDEMKTDDRRFFEVASKVVLDMSNGPWYCGDESMAVLLGWIGARLSSLAMVAPKKRNRTKKVVDLESWADRRKNER